jgi:glyoxylase-like metal-dependent hydrolase (beta-lactamase superfamily II)
MSESTQSWKVGSARVTAVVEAQTDGIPPELFFPAATAATIREHAWLQPHFAQERGTLSLRVQAFVIETGDRLVVVDPCVGNGRERESPFWNDQSWPFMERFRAAGFDPTQVDLVVYTHLHADHVGWGTHRVDGRWVPTFPQARYLFVREELDFLRSRRDAEPDARAIDDDSIAPVFDAGRAELIDADADLGFGLQLEATPGHTPGHASLWVASDGERALLTGDFIHHPVQCAEPTVGFISDADPAQAQATRLAMLGRLADEAPLTLGTHFPTAPAGHVVADDGTGTWAFRPAREALA